MMTTTTKTVAIYARVRTKDQDCGMQLSDLERMAEARGFHVVARYVDQAVSSAKDIRPELDQLMTAARRGEFQAVLVWKFDRFARSLKELVNDALELFQWYSGMVTLDISQVEVETWVHVCM